MENDTFDYGKYNDSIHRAGRIGLSIGVLMLLSAPFLFAWFLDASIEWDGFFSSIWSVLIVYVPSCVVEYLIYVPLLGPGASYLSFITGNITNLKLPCAANAREIAHAEVGSKENEIISTLSVATSSLVSYCSMAPSPVFRYDVLNFEMYGSASITGFRSVDFV